MILIWITVAYTQNNLAVKSFPVVNLQHVGLLASLQLDNFSSMMKTCFHTIPWI